MEWYIEHGRVNMNIKTKQDLWKDVEWITGKK